MTVHSIWGRVSQGPEREVALSEIEVGERLRAVGQGAVADLMVSISETGLIQPIVVRPFECRGGEISLRLVAGAHRLEAHRRLGRETIRARVVEMSDLDALQAEIDENIVRSALGGWERVAFLARRLEVYADRHPDQVAEVGAQVRRGRGRPRKDLFSLGEKNGAERHVPVIMGFVSEVADQTGLARKTLYHDCQIWAALHRYEAQIRTLPLANDTRALRHIAGQPEDRRGAIIGVLAEGRAKSVSDAIAIAAGNTPVKPAQTPVDEAVKAFRRLWGAASPSAREAILADLGGRALPKGWVVEQRG